MDHPAEKDFAPFSIRGKKPGHPDHSDKSGHGSEYEHGGATGFNLTDGVATGGGGSASAPVESVKATPPADSGEVVSQPKSPPLRMEGGIDFTVPPYKRTE